MISFKKHSLSNYAAVTVMLLNTGLFDPSPLVHEIAAESGLTVVKDVNKIINSGPTGQFIKDGLTKVIESRIKRKISLIEKGYDASVKAVNQLIKKHQKLEKGEEFNIIQLQKIISELQLITEMMSQKK